MNEPGQTESPAAQRETSKSPRYPVTPWSTQRLYRPFVRTSLVLALLLGFATGSGMLVAGSFGVDRGVWWITHAQAHGMAQVFGFAGLFTMGIAFHVVPRFKNGSLRFPMEQRVVLNAVIAAVVLRFAGQSIDEHPITGILAVASGILLLLGVIVFVLTIYGSLRSGVKSAGPVQRWIYAALFWAVTSASINMAVGAWLLDHEASIAPHFLNTAMIDAGLYGFIGSFILGVSTRAVSGFLGLKPMYARSEQAAFWVFQLGLGTVVFTLAFEGSAELVAVGRLVLVLGIVGAIFALRILEPSLNVRRPLSPGAYPRFGWFIRSAYAWLVIGAAFIVIESIEVLADSNILPVETNRPVLHIVTMGFVTSMIVGMGCRMIPLFEGSFLAGHRLLDAAFGLLVVSVVSRTAGGFTSNGLADAMLGISGSAGLLAVAFAFWPIFRSMREPAREKYRKLARELGLSRVRLEPGLARASRPTESASS